MIQKAGFNTISNYYQYNNQNYAISKVNSPVSSSYVQDSFTLTTDKPILPPDEKPDYEPPPPPKFFERSDVRAVGMVLGGGAVFGGIGAGIASIAGGSIGLGAALGFGIGVAATIGLAVLSIKAAYGQ